jgi:hypothetical protein
MLGRAYSEGVRTTKEQAQDTKVSGTLLVLIDLVSKLWCRRCAIYLMPSQPRWSFLTTEFAFDDVVLNTRVCRETLARLMARAVSLYLLSHAL